MHHYEEDIKHLKTELDITQEKYNRICNCRMLVGVIGIFLFIYSIVEKNKLSWILFICSCILFLYFLTVHNKVHDNKEYLEAKIQVITKRLYRLTNQWSEFKDTGSEFIMETSYVEKDLDVFGQNSLYQYICVANTIEGKKKLASYLTEQNPNLEVIKEREEAVKELIEKRDFGLELETLSTQDEMNQNDKDDEWYYSFLDYLNLKKPLLNKFVDFSSVLIPISSFILLFLGIQKVIDVKISLLLFVLQVAIAYDTSYQNRNVVGKILRFCSSIDNKVKIIRCMEQAQFESNYLKVLQKRLSSNGKTTKGIEKLNSLNEAFAVQRNPYIHTVLQIAIMYDIHCIRFLENWKRQYAANFQELFQVIGEMEALLSLASIGLDREVTFPDFAYPDFPYPEFSSHSDVMLQGTDIYHPLIAPNEVVSNSIAVNGGVELITGSNMSGKTTFMRTIGINVILAYAGAPVCAKHMKLTVMKLFTSMRVLDDVSKGVSSFYAEVLRMKHIVEYSKSEKPMLVLVDEIFKGTNSADRIEGAQEIIKRLNKKNIIVFVSTHDLELCNLVDNHEIMGNNHHFLEYYKGDNICFDYKLKDGKCNSKNAKYILRMAGLME